LPSTQDLTHEVIIRLGDTKHKRWRLRALRGTELDGKLDGASDHGDKPEVAEGSLVPLRRISSLEQREHRREGSGKWARQERRNVRSNAVGNRAERPRGSDQESGNQKWHDTAVRSRLDNVHTGRSNEESGRGIHHTFKNTISGTET